MQEETNLGKSLQLRQ